MVKVLFSTKFYDRENFVLETIVKLIKFQKHACTRMLPFTQVYTFLLTVF